MPANEVKMKCPVHLGARSRERPLARDQRATKVGFLAWADPRHFPRWFGPAGFSVETKSMDIRVNGEWRFDMIAPDGKRYPNRM